MYGLIALFALPHGLRTWVKSERSGEALRVAMHDRPFVIFLLATLCITVVDFQMGSTFALHVKSLGFPSRAYGLLISMNGRLIVVFEPGITQWTRRLPPRPMIALGYLLAGAGFALTGIARTLPALAATVVIWTLGEMVSSPVASAYAVQLAPERYRGRYLGLVMIDVVVRDGHRPLGRHIRLRAQPGRTLDRMRRARRHRRDPDASTPADDDVLKRRAVGTPRPLAVVDLVASEAGIANELDERRFIDCDTGGRICRVG